MSTDPTASKPAASEPAATMPAATMPAAPEPAVSEPDDAVDVLALENSDISKLLAEWRQATAELSVSDDIDTRWERGSAAKLLVQHAAARESAIELLSDRLATAGRDDLATTLRADLPARREVMARLDELGRGHQAMTLNGPDIDRAVQDYADLFDREQPQEGPGMLDEIRRTLAAAGAPDAPSAKKTYAEAVMRPNVEPSWSDKRPLLKRGRALYQHLRFSPRGGTKPGVDPTREHTK